MNHKLPVVLRSRAFKPVKRLAMLGMGAVLSVPIVAQEEEKLPAEAPPAIQFQVLKTRRIPLGDHSIYLNAVVPPILPVAPPASRTPSAAEVAEAEVAEAREPRKKFDVLFLSATVYDRRVTEIRWQGETGEHRFFSNIDFNLLIGVGGLETSDTIYTLMLALGNEPSAESDGLAQKCSHFSGVNG